MATGNVKTRRNKSADGREAKTLHVLYVQDGKHRIGWALTEKELARVENRALRNPEDIPDCNVNGIVARSKNRDARPEAAKSYYHVRVQSCEERTTDWLVTAHERNAFEERASRNAEDMPLHQAPGLLHYIIATLKKALS